MKVRRLLQLCIQVTTWNNMFTELLMGVVAFRPSYYLACLKPFALHVEVPYLVRGFWRKRKTGNFGARMRYVSFAFATVE